MNSGQEIFINDITQSWKTVFFFIYNLPSVIFWGIRIKGITLHKCVVTIPYSWRTKNPFNSMYFAAQAGAAELSTGILVKASLQGRGKWSMYVTGFKAEYGITAKSRVTFTCEVGDELEKLIAEIERAGNPQEITLVSTGKNLYGEMVSKFYITWSLKKK
ncbi:MAG: hypothetical protein ACJA1A_000524 [Saprospiraceae bacterium]|jgi:hypothetical protein|tara:strand:+ start:554 stop:1033 length:480 start_codon:yes stop_codon:yes gene_type:complete